MELTAQLTPMLRTLRLSGILETLEVRNRQAVEARTSFVEFLTLLLQDEVERRAQQALRLRLRRAAFAFDKTLESFDFSFNPTLNKAQIFDLATCQFVERHENVLLYGPTGVGKSHLAQALAHEACRRGFEVLFVSTAKMLTHLAGGRVDGTLAHRLARYLRPALLVLDDFGLKSLRPPGSRGSLRHHPRAVRAGVDPAHEQPGPFGVGGALRRTLARLRGARPLDPPGALRGDHRGQLPGRADHAATRHPAAE